MEDVSLHGRAWDTIEEELEFDIAQYERAGRSGRADDMRHIRNQIQDQRENGCDPNGADLSRYEEEIADH